MSFVCLMSLTSLTLKTFSNQAFSGVSNDAPLSVFISTKSSALAMNEKNHAEVQQLRLYLQKYPEQAAQLAINHLEDYFVLLNEFKHLQDQIKLFGQSKTPLISSDPSIHAQLTLEQQFRVEILKRNLATEPNHRKANFWAVTYFQYFLHLNESYLETRAELISLKKQPSLPYFL
jgi:hypothetical protein